MVHRRVKQREASCYLLLTLFLPKTIINGSCYGGLGLGAKAIKMHEFDRILRENDCQARKTTKEWEVIDNTDQMWVTGFATIGGREVKEPYLKRFLKLIKAKRVRQANEAVRRKSVDS